MASNYYNSSPYQAALSQIKGLAEQDFYSVNPGTDEGAHLLSSLNRLYKFDEKVNTNDLTSVVSAVQHSFHGADPARVDGKFGSGTAELVIKDTALEPFRAFDLIYDREYQAKIDQAYKYRDTHADDFLAGLKTLYPDETKDAKTLSEAVRKVQEKLGLPGDGDMGPGFADVMISAHSKRKSPTNSHNNEGQFGDIGYIDYTETNKRNTGPEEQKQSGLQLGGIDIDVAAVDLPAQSLPQIKGGPRLIG